MGESEDLELRYNTFYVPETLLRLSLMSIDVYSHKSIDLFFCSVTFDILQIKPIKRGSSGGDISYNWGVNIANFGLQFGVSGPSCLR